MRYTKRSNGMAGARRARSAAGFSLIELVIVVVIIAIIGAIAIPKMSRGAAGANESALVSDLATMRAAIELYAQEHGGTYPTSATTIVAQLTTYTDVTGATTSATRTTTCIYGPYLKSVPPLPVGTYKTQTTIVAGSGMSACGTTAGGWLYDGQTVWANDPATDTDMAGKTYQSY